jgi:hypothetical protein
LVIQYWRRHSPSAQSTIKALKPEPLVSLAPPLQVRSPCDAVS